MDNHIQNQQKKRIKIIDLEIYTSICPFQCFGTTDKDEYVYIRERFGHLTIEINNNLIFTKSNIFINGIYGNDGIESIINMTSDIIDWLPLSEITEDIENGIIIHIDKPLIARNLFK